MVSMDVRGFLAAVLKVAALTYDAASSAVVDLTEAVSEADLIVEDSAAGIVASMEAVGSTAEAAAFMGEVDSTVAADSMAAAEVDSTAVVEATEAGTAKTSKANS